MYIVALRFRFFLCSFSSHDLDSTKHYINIFVLYFLFVLIYLGLFFARTLCLSLSVSDSVAACLFDLNNSFLLYIHMTFYSFHFGHIKFKQKWKHWNANSIILIHNPHIDCMSGWMDECMNEYINFYWLECNTHILSSPYQTLSFDWD